MGQTGFASASGREDRTLRFGAAPGMNIHIPEGNRQDSKPAGDVEKKSHAMYWWIGGIAVAAGVAGGYYMYASSSEAPPRKPTYRSPPIGTAWPIAVR